MRHRGRRGYSPVSTTGTARSAPLPWCLVRPSARACRLIVSLWLRLIERKALSELIKESRPRAASLKWHFGFFEFTSQGAGTQRPSP